ncbi:MAG: integrase [Candidatus Paceibacteria bacterium]|jgi:integrase
MVLSREEVRAVLAQMDGTRELIAQLLCGAGLRLNECARLRLRDTDLESRISNIDHAPAVWLCARLQLVP